MKCKLGKTRPFNRFRVTKMSLLTLSYASLHYKITVAPPIGDIGVTGIYIMFHVQFIALVESYDGRLDQITQ